MNPDGFLSGGKKEKSRRKQLSSFSWNTISEKDIEEGFNRKENFAGLNPTPYMKIIDMKGRDKKVHHGIEVGLNFSF